MTGIYSLLEGKTLSGRYHIERLISRGGMGAVFRATDQHLSRPVAVKVIALEPETPEQAANLRARFRREAHAAARLRHANVVTLHDFGTDETMGLDFIVMELLEGEDIQRRVRRTGPLPWRQASRILYEAGRGLGAGHRAGLVHRDVKSANLFLEHDAAGKPVRTRVLDFGIAQLASEGAGTATHLTMLGHAPLSPPYASPEQQRGERELTPAADVWGLGVTAFEMLTGTLPFTEEQRAALATGARIPPPSVCRINPSAPAEADALIRRALSPIPSERPADGEAFAREVSAIRRGVVPPPASLPLLRDDPFAAAPVPAPSASTLAAPQQPPAAPVPEPIPAVTPRPGSRKTGAVFLAFAAIALVFAGALWTALPREARTDTPSVQQAFPSEPAAPSRPATEEEIDHIRRVYRQIESGGQALSQRRLDLGDFGRRAWPSADSAYATVYEGFNDVRKIRVRVYTQGERKSLLFYYDVGRLVFIHEVTTPPGASTNLEQRFYFRDRALIRWRDTGNALVPFSGGYDDVAGFFLPVSDGLLAVARGAG